MPIPIVICDDSSFARKQMARALPSGWNVDVTFAANGIEGLEAIRAGKADILFLDLTMPELDGFGVLEAIRKEDLNTMVIVVSGDIQPESRARVTALGALDFIKKPIDAETLSTVLDSYGILSELTAQEVSAPTQEVDLYDWCREITNVAMGRGADLVAQLLKVPVTLSLPEVSLISSEQICDTLFGGGDEERMTLVSQGFIGRDFSGETLVLFNRKNDDGLKQLLHREGVNGEQSLEEMEMELASLMTGAMLNGWARQLDIQLSLGHPQPMNSEECLYHCSAAAKREPVLAIKLHYRLESVDFHCSQLLLFTHRSLESLNNYAELALVQGN